MCLNMKVIVRQRNNIHELVEEFKRYPKKLFIRKNGIFPDYIGCVALVMSATGFASVFLRRVTRWPISSFKTNKQAILSKPHSS
jgi:hypothetical protein